MERITTHRQLNPGWCGYAIRAFQTMDLQSIKTGNEYTYPFRPNIETNFSQRPTAVVLKCWRIYTGGFTPGYKYFAPLGLAQQ